MSAAIGFNARAEKPAPVRLGPFHPPPFDDHGRRLYARLGVPPMMPGTGRISSKKAKEGGSLNVSYFGRCLRRLVAEAFARLL
jgi:hypothetical protein